MIKEILEGNSVNLMLKQSNVILKCGETMDKAIAKIGKGGFPDAEKRLALKVNELMDEAHIIQEDIEAGVYG